MYRRESKIMRKLLGGKPAPDTNETSSSLNAPTSTPATYRPSNSQNAVYKANVPISCLDVSPDRRSVALGGLQILKTVTLDDPTSFDFNFSEGVDVRAAITAQPSTVKTASAPDQLNVRDVKWLSNTTIATACANGRIFAYDVARIGEGTAAEPLEYLHIQEDTRQVNTLDVNPHLKSWLVSGSQDGLARIFDTANAVHTRSGYLTFRQRFAALRCNEPIRQVKWSPRRGQELACCTEGGIVYKWDVRQPSRPLLRIPAHEKACTGIAWHPDGIHLMTGGSDCKLHVWDMGDSADRRQKPKWTITTPAPVKTLAWRPGLWSATAQSRRVAQVAVTYEEQTKKRYGTSVVHIWDLARPMMPYKEIERFEQSPDALSWQDQDMLWTVGGDGRFCQSDVAHSPRLVDRMSTSAISFSSKGDVVMFLDERPQQPRPRPTGLNQSDTIPRTSIETSPRGQVLSVSRSDSEEDVLGSFLSPRRRMHRRAVTNSRMAHSMSTTPPGGPSSDASGLLGLEKAIKVTGQFKSQQAMATGHVPAAQSVQLYQYLTTVYLETLKRELPATDASKSLVERVTHIMKEYAAAAEKSRLFRLSQTWRILAFAVGLLLTRRAEYHQKIRIDWHEAQKQAAARDVQRKEAPGESPGHSLGTGGRLTGPVRSSEDIHSTSNVPTPRVRPADRAGRQETNGYQYGKKLTPVAEPDSFSLGPSNQGPFQPGSPRRRLDSAPLSFTSEDSGATRASHTEGYDFYDMETLAMAINVPFSRNRSSTRLREGSVDDPDVRQRRISRHGSGDSFGQMFSTSDVTKQASTNSSGSPGPSRPPLISQMSMMSTESNGEYGSRIRGELLRNSSPDKPPVRRRRAMTDSPENIFLVSQTTMTTDDSFPYPSQSSFPSADSDSQRHNDSVVDLDKPERSSTFDSKPSEPQSQQTSYYDPSPDITEVDYLPWHDDPPYPFTETTTATTFTNPFDLSKLATNNTTTPATLPNATAGPPLDPYKLITDALDFESRTSALNASAIILLLRPLVPDSVIDFHRASAVLRQHHHRLQRMSLFIEAALLRNLCVKGWPGGALADIWGDHYTAIFSQAQQNVKVGLSCTNCKKAREIDPRGNRDVTVWTCERCRHVMAPCAVCGHREPQISFDSPDADDSDASSLSGWWYCPGCAHGGHASCLSMWHQSSSSSSHRSAESSKYSGGACPLDGCGHACIPGRYRGELTTSRAEETGRAALEHSRSSSRRASPTRGTPMNIKSDGNDIPQSRAVGVAREALNKSGGILSSSPGRNTGERERRKSVKFAGTSH